MPRRTRSLYEMCGAAARRREKTLITFQCRCTGWALITPFVRACIRLLAPWAPPVPAYPTWHPYLQKDDYVIIAKSSCACTKPARALGVHVSGAGGHPRATAQAVRIAAAVAELDGG